MKMTLAVIVLALLSVVGVSAQTAPIKISIQTDAPSVQTKLLTKLTMDGRYIVAKDSHYDVILFFTCMGDPASPGGLVTVCAVQSVYQPDKYMGITITVNTSVMTGSEDSIAQNILAGLKDQFTPANIKTYDNQANAIFTGIVKATRDYDAQHATGSSRS